MCAAALPVLLAAGGGAIVCVSSRAARAPVPRRGRLHHGQGRRSSAFVDALAEEYRDDDVRINAILPSTIDTPANRSSMPDADFDTWVKPEEIAASSRSCARTTRA
jgi:NAD(P)-dependent dehydrogenase (short-subunit alcohol dehydrogenase family)